MPVKAELSAARRKKRRARQYHISAAAPDYDANQGARFEVYFTKHRGFYGPEAQPFEARLIEGRWHTCDIQRDSDEETMRAFRSRAFLFAISLTGLASQNRQLAASLMGARNESSRTRPRACRYPRPPARAKLSQRDKPRGVPLRLT